MSKSLGNFFTVRDLLDQGVPGEVMRFVLLSTHYRAPMDWTEKKKTEATETLRKWRGLTEGIDPSANPSPAFVEALSDDLNTAGAMAELHRLAKVGEVAELKASAALLGLLQDGHGDWAEADAASGDAATMIEQLLAARVQARADKDFALSDKIRDGLAAAGVKVKDTPEGASWELGPDFDPAKLEALK